MPRVWPDGSVVASSLYSSLQVMPPADERSSAWRVTDDVPTGTSATARAHTTSELRGSIASSSNACGSTPSRREVSGVDVKVAPESIELGIVGANGDDCAADVA